MSYNKNTVYNSQINTVIRILELEKIKYKLKHIAAVKNFGINIERNYLPIHRLETDNFVLLERIERHADCDMDDVITATLFPRNKEPLDWPTEVIINDLFIDDDDTVSGNDF